MASDSDKCYFGDSAINANVYDPKARKSNHIFDGAGENIQYYSDSESVTSRKSRTRYINPAIYIEPVESTRSVTSLQADSYISDVTPHPHGTYRSNSTPLLSGRESSASSSVKRKSCRLEEIAATDRDDLEETPRCGRTYREDGPDTFRLSVISASTTTTAKQDRERNEDKRQEAFKQWVARKDQEKREKARLEKKKRQPVPAKTTSQEQREESYRRWLERKRSQTERQRAEDIMRRYRHNEKIETEKQRKEREKEEKLAEWARRKEEAMKAMKTAAEHRAARAAMEEERRRSKGERAYRDWLRTSKNKPLPVPLNQGELSMRGSVSQMYINPVPWEFPT